MIDERLKKRFLVRIVDDDAGVLTGLSFLLQCLGWKSLSYSDAQQFLENDNLHVPGCVLLDIRMPGMSGLQLQEKLFEDGVRLPVVIITGYADVETAVRTLKRGAFDFLQKPIQAEKLEEVLENCCNRRNTGFDQKTPQELASIFHELGPREKTILSLMREGCTSKQIGERLGISERTVQGHRLNLSKKFGVHGKGELLSCLEVIESFR